MYDIVIVGAGIAGLYSAYKIKKSDPSLNIIVLERYSKKFIGGRANNEKFAGVSVVTGAGVGRKKKDKLLFELIKEVKLPFHEFTASHDYAKTIHPNCHVKRAFTEIKDAYKKTDPSPKMTFKEFATSVIGPERYKHFITCSSYTDYENEDIHDTLYNYGFDDNYGEWIGLSFSWKDLVSRMVNAIGEKNIKCNRSVKKINYEDEFNYSVEIEGHSNVLCRKVIIATTIDTIMKIVPSASKQHSLYKEIHGQPFLRVYGKFDRASCEIMKQYVKGLTVVPGPLQKIIPMDTSGGVYMIAYSDNASAKKLKPALDDTSQNRSYFCRLLERSLGIEKNVLELTSITDFYWDIGTHYYSPLSNKFKTRSEFIKKAQNPFPGMVIVGEVISKNQGWVEGALESVDEAVTQNWIMI